jgi:hypothetical protein
MMMEYSTDDPTYSLLGDMQEPVLVSTKPNNKVRSTTRYFNFLSFLTGSYMSVVHPFLVFSTLRTAHLETVDHRFLLALGWTVLTCLVYFLGMRVWLRMAQDRFQECSEAMLFQMEAHYIAGSLLGTSISLIPQVTLLIKSAPRGPLIAALAVAGMMLWFPLVLCLIPINKRSSDIGDNSKTRNKKVGAFSRKKSRYLAYILFGGNILLDICLDWVYNERGKSFTFQLLLLYLSLLAGSVFAVIVCSLPEEEIPEERESLI